MVFQPDKKSKYSMRMVVQKIFCVVIAAALAISLTACQQNAEGTESAVNTASQSTANTTYTGTVTEISAESITVSTEGGTTVTAAITSDTVLERGMGPGGGGGQPPEGTPPQQPGQASGGESMAQSGETPPEMPEGQAPEGMGQGMPQEELTVDSIAVGASVTLEVDENNTAITITLSGGMGGPGGGSSAPESYSAVNEYTEDTSVSNTSLSSEGTDENTVLVQTAGITAALDNVNIVRNSQDSTGGDSSSFYGVGAAALVTDGTLSISNSTIESDAAGGAGVFAYGNGTAYVSDATITAMQNTAGGIHVAGGGTLYAWDLNVETNGESSAAIRSDRGSGTMVVDGGSYTANGVGSPAVYSTADITVHDAELTANGSEAICIEGLNTIRLFDCDLTGNMSDLEQNDCTWNVILYQSMSGDSEVGNSTFEMSGGTLTAKNGGMFYTTNTKSTFVLSDVKLVNADDSGFLLKCTGNSNQRGWGTAGANGADSHFTAIQQTMEGNVIWDSISKLDFYLTQGSTWTGAMIQDESNAGAGGDGYGSVYIDADSTWIVTGDSTVSALSCAGTMKDSEGNTVSVVGTDGTVYVEGTSAHTVTVGSYSDTGDVSGASALDAWESFEVENLNA